MAGRYWPTISTSSEAFEQPLPSQLAVAVQDHGFSANESNRTLRIRLWKDFIAQGVLSDLVFTEKYQKFILGWKPLKK